MSDSNNPFDAFNQAISQHNNGQPQQLTPELTAKLVNVILFALVSGLVVMATILVGIDFLKKLNNPVFEIDPLLAALGIAGLTTSIILPPIIRAVPPDKKLNETELCQKFQISMIVKYGILEGAAFASIFMNQSLSLFGVGVFVVLVIAMIFSYVTTNQVHDYIKHVRENSEFD